MESNKDEIVYTCTNPQVINHTLFCDGNCWNCGYHRQLVDDRFVIKNMQLPVPDDNDLNDAAQKFSIDVTGNTDFSVIRSFKVGATWQKRKMVGSAFEGGAYSYRNGYIHVSCDIDENTTDIKLGDRVKLIVVPVK